MNRFLVFKLARDIKEFSKSKAKGSSTIQGHFRLTEYRNRKLFPVDFALTVVFFALYGHSRIPYSFLA